MILTIFLTIVFCAAMAKPYAPYSMEMKNTIANWNGSSSADTFSMDDRLLDLMKKPEGFVWIMKFLGLCAKKKIRRDQEENEKADTGIIRFHTNITVMGYLSLFERLGISLKKEETEKLIRQLKTIRK